jgi:hypothetical protein
LQQITVDYLARLGACWPRSKLEQAAKLWPSDPTWAWFLGSRLDDLAPNEQLERLHMAIAHVLYQRITLPTPLGEILALAKRCHEGERLTICEALGHALDVDPQAPPEAHAASLEALHAAIIAAKQSSGVIEAKP